MEAQLNNEADLKTREAWSKSIGLLCILSHDGERVATVEELCDATLKLLERQRQRGMWEEREYRQLRDMEANTIRRQAEGSTIVHDGSGVAVTAHDRPITDKEWP